MSPNIFDRRQFRRIYFSKADNITSDIFLSTDPVHPIPVYVLTLSEKGLSLFVQRDLTKNINIGDTVTLKSINTPEPLGLIDEVEAKIIYILSDNGIDHVSVGCKFLEISETDINKIRKFIEHMHKEAGSIC